MRNVLQLTLSHVSALQSGEPEGPSPAPRAHRGRQMLYCSCRAKLPTQKTSSLQKQEHLTDWWLKTQHLPTRKTNQMLLTAEGCGGETSEILCIEASWH